VVDEEVEEKVVDLPLKRGGHFRSA